MKADDGHFARLLADLPEPLSQDLLFIRDLQSRCKRVVVKKGIISCVPEKCARMPILSIKDCLLINILMIKEMNV